ncbi:MAG: AI-2E family transporter [Pararhizobium sp.]
MRYERIQPPVVRLPPKSNFEVMLSTVSRGSLVMAAIVILMAGLHYAEVVFAPAALAVIVGLMFGPVARRIERAGIPAGISAAFVVLLFLAIIVGGVALFVPPLTVWFEKLPTIWAKLKLEMLDWRSVFKSIGDLRDQLQAVAGNDAAMKVRVEDGGAIQTMIAMGPSLVAQAILFLACLYFFVATRDQIRVSILSMCISRRMRWRAAHVFRDVEWYVSRYLLSITAINIGLGVAVAAAMAIAGVPSPILWGLLATVLNYVIYIGPAVMAVTLFGVGLATGDDVGTMLLPVGIYLVIDFIEAQFVTPHVLGRTLTLNPFLVFIALAFWLWLWGPVGGLVAVPSLLIWHAILSNILPRMRSVSHGL